MYLFCLWLKLNRQMLFRWSEEIKNYEVAQKLPDDHNELKHQTTHFKRIE